MKTITVKGVGTASVKPDYITIMLRIASKDKDYSKSVDNANERIAMLQNAITSVGFVKEDLKTLMFRVGTFYDNDGKKQRATYVCNYSLKLSFDLDTNRLAQTLNAISDSGADANFNIQFTVKNPERVNQELLKSAAENARQKAEILCAASGVNLGELVSINYDWGEVSVVSASMYSMSMERERGICSVPEFEPEDIQSNDTATFVWEVK